MANRILGIFNTVNNKLNNLLDDSNNSANTGYNNVTDNSKLLNAGRFVGSNETMKRFHLGNEFGSESYNVIFSEGFEDPTFLTFKIEFGDWGFSIHDLDEIAGILRSRKNSNITFQDYDQFPMGLLNIDYIDFNSDFNWNDLTLYNAYNYLMNRNEDTRALYIKTFAEGLYVLLKDMPYIFQKINGLDKLLEFNPTSGLRVKDAKITIECLEGIDLKIKTLLLAYRKAAYDDIWQRWILPDIYRYFKMIIYVFDRRYVQTGENAMYSPEQDEFPIYAFECGPCEFDIESILNSDYSVVYGEQLQATSKLTINVKNVKTYYSNALFNKLDPLMINWFSDLETKAEKQEAESGNIYNYINISPDSSKKGYRNYRMLWMQRLFLNYDEYFAFNDMKVTHKVGDENDHKLLERSDWVKYSYYPDNDWHYATVSDSIFNINSWKTFKTYLKHIITSKRKIIRDSRTSNRDVVVNDLIRPDERTYYYDPIFNPIKLDYKRVQKQLADSINVMVNKMLNNTYIIDNTTYIKLQDPGMEFNLDKIVMQYITPIFNDAKTKQEFVKPIIDLNNPDINPMVKPNMNIEHVEHEYVSPEFNDEHAEYEYVYPEFNDEHVEHEYVSPELNIEHVEHEYVSPLFNLTKPKLTMVEPIFNLDKHEIDMVEPEFNLDKPNQELIEPIFNLDKHEMDMVEPEFNLDKPKQPLVKPKFNLGKPEMDMVEPEFNLDKSEMNMIEPIFNLDKIKLELIEPIFNLDKIKLNLVEPIFNNDKPIHDLIKPVFNLDKLEMNMVEPIIDVHKELHNMVEPIIDIHKEQHNMIEPIIEDEHQEEMNFVTPVMNNDKLEMNMVEPIIDVHKELHNMVEPIIEEHLIDMNFIKLNTDTSIPDMNMIKPVNNLDKTEMKFIKLNTDTSVPNMNMVEPIIDIHKELHNMVEPIIEDEHQQYNQMTEPIFNIDKAVMDMISINQDISKTSMDLIPLDISVSKISMNMTDNIHNPEKSEMDMMMLLINDSKTKMDMIYLDTSISKVSMDMTDNIHNPEKPDIDLIPLNTSVSKVSMNMTDNIHNPEKPDIDMIIPSMNLEKSEMDMMSLLINDSKPDMDMIPLDISISKPIMNMTELDLNISKIELPMTELNDYHYDVSMSYISPNLDYHKNNMSEFVKPEITEYNQKIRITENIALNEKYDVKMDMTDNIHNPEKSEMDMIVPIINDDKLEKKIHMLTSLNESEIKHADIDLLISLADIINETVKLVKEKLIDLVANKPNISKHVHMKMVSIKQPPRNTFIVDNLINEVDEAALDRAFNNKQDHNKDRDNDGNSYTSQHRNGTAL